MSALVVGRMPTKFRTMRAAEGRPAVRGNERTPPTAGPTGTAGGGERGGRSPRRAAASGVAYRGGRAPRAGDRHGCRATRPPPAMDGWPAAWMPLPRMARSDERGPQAPVAAAVGHAAPRGAAAVGGRRGRMPRRPLKGRALEHAPPSSHALPGRALASGGHLPA